MLPKPRATQANSTVGGEHEAGRARSAPSAATRPRGDPRERARVERVLAALGRLVRNASRQPPVSDLARAATAPQHDQPAGDELRHEVRADARVAAGLGQPERDVRPRRRPSASTPSESATSAPVRGRRRGPVPRLLLQAERVEDAGDALGVLVDERLVRVAARGTGRFQPCFVSASFHDGAIRRRPSPPRRARRAAPCVMPGAPKTPRQLPSSTSMPCSLSDGMPSVAFAATTPRARACLPALDVLGEFAEARDAARSRGRR